MEGEDRRHPGEGDRGVGQTGRGWLVRKGLRQKEGAPRGLTRVDGELVTKTGGRWGGRGGDGEEKGLWRRGPGKSPVRRPRGAACLGPAGSLVGRVCGELWVRPPGCRAPKDFSSASPLFVWQVVCGQDHSLFLTDKGEVYSCGWGADGQTGRGPPPLGLAH